MKYNLFGLLRHIQTIGKSIITVIIIDQCYNRFNDSKTECSFKTMF